MVPLGFDEIVPAIAERRVDFIFTNPSQFVCAELVYSIRAIATILNRRFGFALSTFGAVIFRSKNRTDIATIEDIQGKVFESVDLSSLGGWQMGYRTLKGLSLSPFVLASEFRLGGTHPNVVLDVINGSVDVGTVRTDTLEGMVAAGTISMDQIVILHAQKYSGFPFEVSTELYPEWNLAVLAHVTQALIRQVAIALVTLNSSVPLDKTALSKAKIDSWVPPLSYVPVYSALRDIELVNQSTGECIVSDSVQFHLMPRWLH